MYNTYGKENNDEDVKGMYILLSGTLAVASAVRGSYNLVCCTMLDVVYNQISIPWYGCSPTLHQCGCPGHGPIPLFHG